MLKLTLTCSRELWVVTKRTRSCIQTGKMSFLCRVADLSRRYRVRSSEPLLLYVQSSRLRWFGRLIKMPSRCLPLKVFTARRTVGQTQCLSIPHKKLKIILGTLGILCLLTLDKKKRVDEWRRSLLSITCNTDDIKFFHGFPTHITWWIISKIATSTHSLANETKLTHSKNVYA